MWSSAPLANSAPATIVQAFPVALNAGKTSFIDHSGNPCFGCGDAPQYLIEQLSKSDIEVYLADRAGRGINILWMIAADALYQSNPPKNLAGDAPFSGADFTNFNEPYWAYVDYVMQRALVWGQTVLFMPAFMGDSPSGGYQTSWKAASDAVLQGYAAFLAARYGSSMNLIYVVGGDSDPADTALYAKLNTFATALKAADPNHLITLEALKGFTNGGRNSVDGLTTALGSVPSWLDINAVDTTPATIPSNAQRSYGQGYPCFLFETDYELVSGVTSLSLRACSYGSVLGGCTLGYQFGNAVIWPFNSTSAISGNLQSPTWQSQLSSQGSTDLQRFGKLVRSRAFQLLVPDISNAVMTTGAASGSVCARTSDGKTIIAYLPTSQTVTMDMTKITDGTNLANCNWYNPQTGAVTAIGNIANSGSHNFTSPDSNDWVLVIDSAAAVLRMPGT